jgi:hypothetical protein
VDGDGFGNLPDLGLDGADGILGVIAAIVFIIFVAAFVAFVLIPLAILLVEILIFVVLAWIGVAGRLAFRRPWRLEATVVGDASSKMVWSVAGWRDSREALVEIATALERGQPVVLSSVAGASAG